MAGAVQCWREPTKGQGMSVGIAAGAHCRPRLGNVGWARVVCLAALAVLAGLVVAGPALAAQPQLPRFTSVPKKVRPDESVVVTAHVPVGAKCRLVLTRNGRSEK